MAVIVLVGSFTTCFVSSGALTTLAVINAARGPSRPSFDSEPPPPRRAPDEADESVAAPKPAVIPDDPVAAADPDPLQDEELSPPDEDAPELDFEGPRLGQAEFAVYHQDKARLDPWAALQKAAKGTRVKVFKSPAPSSAVPPYVVLRDLPADEYKVILGPIATGRGLTPAMKSALPRARRASVLDAYMPLGVSSLLEVSKVMAAFTQATGGIIWDEEAQEYLALDSWKTRRVDSWDKGVPHVALNFTVFVDSSKKEVSIRSAGMKHLGLPELELKNIPPLLKDSGVALLNATAQTLAEAKGPAAPGSLEVSLSAIRHAQHRKTLEEKLFTDGDGVVDVVLVPGGTGKVPTLALTFTGPGAPSEKVETAIVTLFGSEE